jgi:hypothetical protein
MLVLAHRAVVAERLLRAGGGWAGATSAGLFNKANGRIPKGYFQ